MVISWNGTNGCNLLVCLVFGHSDRQLLGLDEHHRLETYSLSAIVV